MARRSSGRLLKYASVSFTVTVPGRNLSPAFSALSMERRWKPFVLPMGGAQMGMSPSPSSPFFARNSEGTHTSFVSVLPAASLHAASSPPMVHGFSGPVAL